MRVLVVGILVLALAVAGVSTYLIQTFSGEENIEELQKEAQKPKLSVLVATKKLWPGDVLRADAMTWQVWVDESLNENFIAVEGDDQKNRRMKEFAGGRVRFVINRGEPILASKIFKSEKPGFLAGALAPGKVAVAVKVSPTTAAAGFILPGDHVDVLLTHDKAREVVRKKQKDANDPDAPLTLITHTTETIIKDLRVLAVDAFVGKVEGQSVPAAKTVTLELDPKQAEILTTARAMGNLSLVLRSLAGEPETANQRTFTTDVDVSPLISNINDVLEGRRDDRARLLEKRIKTLENEKRESEKTSAPTVAAKPEKKKTVIKIYRGKGGATEEFTVK